MDEPENTQDISSGEDTGTPAEPETFSKEQMEAERSKARSDALAELGRYKKSAEQAIESASKAQQRLEQYIRDQEEQELESAKDEPEKTKTLRANQELRRKNAELAKAQQEKKDLEDELTTIKGQQAESTKERKAREIATQYGVDASRVIDLAKFTDGSPEAIEAIASSLPKKQKEPQLKPDTGGQVGTSTNVQKALERYWKGEISEEEARKQGAVFG